jgi:hypothetical protein
MFLKVGTLKTYSSLAVLVTTKRPLSAGGKNVSAWLFHDTEWSVHTPSDVNAIVATRAASIDKQRQPLLLYWRESVGVTLEEVVERSVWRN